MKVKPFSESNNKYPDELYMNTKEASKLWNVSVDTVRRWCREKKLFSIPEQDSKRQWRIPRSTQIPQKRKK